MIFKNFLPVDRVFTIIFSKKHDILVMHIINFIYSLYTQEALPMISSIEKDRERESICFLLKSFYFFFLVYL